MVCILLYVLFTAVKTHVASPSLKLCLEADTPLRRASIRRLSQSTFQTQSIEP